MVQISVAAMVSVILAPTVHLPLVLLLLAQVAAPVLSQVVCSQVVQAVQRLLAQAYHPLALLLAQAVDFRLPLAPIMQGSMAPIRLSRDVGLLGVSILEKKSPGQHPSLVL